MQRVLHCNAPLRALRVKHVRAFSSCFFISCYFRMVKILLDVAFFALLPLLQAACCRLSGCG
jgi:hypothetical protein